MPSKHQILTSHFGVEGARTGLQRVGREHETPLIVFVNCGAVVRNGQWLGLYEDKNRWSLYLSYFHLFALCFVVDTT